LGATLDAARPSQEETPVAGLTREQPMQSTMPLASEPRTDPIATVSLWHLLPLLCVASAVAVVLVGHPSPPELEKKVQALAMAAAVVAWWRWVVADATRRAGFRAVLPRAGAVLRQAGMVALCSFLLTMVWMTVRSWIDLPSLGLVKAPTLIDNKSSLEIRALSVLAVGLLAPAAEELLFRGALFRKWRLSWGARNAALVTSVLFGFMHSQPVTSSLFALSMAVLYTTTRTIWAPVAAHMLNNLLAIALLSAIPVIPTALLVAAADVRVQLAALVPGIAGAFWLVRFLRRNWHTLGDPVDGV
jgi:membrane protease YdiL (CAAX protease family)